MEDAKVSSDDVVLCGAISRMGDKCNKCKDHKEAGDNWHVFTNPHGGRAEWMLDHSAPCSCGDCSNSSKPNLTGAERIASERRRQVVEERYTAETDARLPDGSLAAAAVCYASDEPVFVREEHATGFSMVDPWPWDRRHDKRPYHGNVVEFKWTLEERISLLVRAGALIAAEIDNLLYKDRTIRPGVPAATTGVWVPPAVDTGVFFDGERARVVATYPDHAMGDLVSSHASVYLGRSSEGTRWHRVPHEVGVHDEGCECRGCRDGRVQPAAQPSPESRKT